MSRLVIISILLLFGCSPRNPSASTVFKANMYVIQVAEAYKLCDYRPVIWGWKSDTICFYIDQVRCFKALTSSSEKELGILVVAISLETQQRHTIRYIRQRDGFMFFISNQQGFPQFVLSSTNICDR